MYLEDVDLLELIGRELEDGIVVVFVQNLRRVVGEISCSTGWSENENETGR